MTRPEGSPLPPRLVGAFLGVWVAVLLVLAFVLVPALFATCVAT